MLEEGKYLIVSLGTLVVCQIIKFMIESIKAHKLKWARLFNGSGGMPSSHTSFAVSITMMVGIHMGFLSPLFAISLVFTMIVMYDAFGLRMESSKHAVMLNQIVDSMFEGHPVEGYTKLKEHIGHKPLEVLMGLLLGISTSLFYSFVIL